MDRDDIVLVRPGMILPLDGRENSAEENEPEKTSE